jgi:dihydrofolate synthase / folylpolyglutamate synthase
MNYEEAIEWIHARLRLGIKPGLTRMEWMLEKLGSPEKKIKAVHVGGTNGKGSTVTYLRNVLQAAEYNVGTFTSPYFEKFNERISINGIPVSNEEIVELVKVIRPLAEELEQTEWGGPSEFEVITIMSFYYFAEIRPVDLVIYEVGLGGRLDSTNVITPLVSVITSIGYDHMQFLGDTLAEIAYEKAGIIKKNIPVITAVKQLEALNVIEKKAATQNSELFVLGRDFRVEHLGPLETGESFYYSSKKQQDEFVISMIGKHQVENASLALTTIELLNATQEFIIKKEAIINGLKKANWPGRMERLSTEPLVFLDGAHNPESVAALVETVNSRFQNEKVHILFAALKDKKVENMLEQLESVALSIAFTSFDFPRAATAKELYETSTHSNKKLVEDWYHYILELLPSLKEDDVLIITGSLYFLSTIKPELIKLLEK